MDINKFIAEHSSFLSWLIAALIAVWFVSGVVAVDYIEASVYVAVWVPLGIAWTLFALNWT